MIRAAVTTVDRRLVEANWSTPDRLVLWLPRRHPAPSGTPVDRMEASARREHETDHRLAQDRGFRPEAVRWRPRIPALCLVEVPLTPFASALGEIGPTLVAIFALHVAG